MTGKTAKLIEESHKTRNYILVKNQRQAKQLYDLARDMRMDIPYPISINDVKNGRSKGSSINRDGILVDNALDVLQEVLEIPINMATVRKEM